MAGLFRNQGDSTSLVVVKPFQTMRSYFQRIYQNPHLLKNKSTAACIKLELRSPFYLLTKAPRNEAGISLLPSCARQISTPKRSKVLALKKATLLSLGICTSNISYLQT